MVIAPVALQQYRFYRDAQGRLVGFAAWAFLSAEVEARLNAGDQRLAPNDWKSGDRAWLLTVMSGAGQAPAVLEDLRVGALSRHRINYHRRTPEGRMIAEHVMGKDAAPAN
jgi:cytolysin-activating lysine-acyltransferase